MASKRRTRIALILLTAAVGLGGCELLSDGFASLQNASGPRKLSDDDAFRHLQRDRTAATPQNLGAMLDAMDLEVARENGQTIEPTDPDVIALLKRSIRPRLGIEEDTFIRLEPGYFTEFAAAEEGIVSQKQSCTFDLNLNLLQTDRFLIPQADKIPVRDQRVRGTCAAFAGTATVEYAALNPREGEAAGLPTLDLSEEYFYWSSKPDCQSPGACDCPGSGCSQGSWYGSGFAASASAGGLNIPLEGDCNYEPYVGDSDTHHPLPSSCDRGAVQVESVDEFCGADDLVGLLHSGYAVPWASPLTSNWEQNDGLITRKGAGELGDTIHAGGHAYLIVGYRRLPDMPDEGGMCFIIKNSWGTGWGLNGYSCMTLAWMRAVTYDGFLSYGQPVAMRVTVRDDLASGSLPDDDDQGTNDDLPDDGSDDGTVNPDPPDVLPEPLPTPDPPPEPEPDAWRSGRMYGPDDTWFRVETQTVEGDFFVRGELVGGEGGDGVSRYLRLNGGDNGTLMYKGDEVGRHDQDGDLIGGSVRLCTAEWAHLCALRYRASDGLLYVQFRDDDLRSVKSEEVSANRGEWFQVRLGGNTYGLFMPGNIDSAEFLLDPKTYLRLGDSQPVRLSLRHRLSEPSEFSIRIQGYPVGRLSLFQPDRSSLCSGDFANRCQIVNDGRLTVVPRNSGKL